MKQFYTKNFTSIPLLFVVVSTVCFTNLNANSNQTIKKMVLDPTITIDDLDRCPSNKENTVFNKFIVDRSGITGWQTIIKKELTNSKF